MVIDLQNLRKLGQLEKDLVFDYNPPSSLLSILDSQFNGATINVHISVYDDCAYLQGQICYTIIGPCSKCLSDAKYFGKIDFDEQFVSDTSDLTPEDDLVIYSRDKIDLTNYVNQLILTDMPYALMCRDDCKGLCFVCGHNLNEGECGCDRRNN